MMKNMFLSLFAILFLITGFNLTKPIHATEIINGKQCY